ncbi:MAG: hypothetical protein IT325_09870 [Anaerolineae bacterium]|nr:hypothetical protein [Anaerolineae bacterium]
MRPTDLIRDALRAIGVAGVGQRVGAADTNDAFATLNGLLDQWSIQKLMVAYQNEIIHPLAPDTDRYTIGPNGSISALIAASIAADVMTVTQVITGSIVKGMTLQTATPETHITAFLSGGGGDGPRAVGTYQVAPLQTQAQAPLSAQYPRPIGIRSAFVRTNVGGNTPLDHPVSPLAAANWQRISQKSLPGPWPQALYFQATENNANLWYWPVPTQASEMHLFADAILSRFASVEEQLTLPQGTELALRYGLAELLLVDYGVNDELRIRQVKDLAKRGRDLIKASNAVPQEVIAYDPAIVSRGGASAGWILHGGFSPT